MADIQLSRPAANQTQTVTSAADARFVLNFATGEAKLAKSENGENLILTFDDGAKIEVEGFYTTFNKDSLPTLNVGGQDISGEQLAAVLGEDLMPAAGPAAQSAAQQGGRFRSFADTALDGGIDRLGGLDIGFTDGVQLYDSPEGYYALADDATTTGEVTPEPMPAPSPTPTPTPPIPTPAPTPEFIITPPTGALAEVYESALAWGSKPGDMPTVDGGAFIARSTNSTESVSINGVEIWNKTGLQTTDITLPNGTLKITGYDPASGEVSYTFELSSAPTASGLSVASNVEVTVVDATGADSKGSVTVATIFNDAPVAKDDNGKLDVHAHTLTGDVIPNDVPGADGGIEGTVMLVDGTAKMGDGSPVTVDVQNGTVQTNYGTLTLNPDGTYTFVMPEGTRRFTQLEVRYQITDADGDTSEATLTIDLATAFKAQDDYFAAGVMNKSTTDDLIINDTLGANPGEAVVSVVGDGGASEYGAELMQDGNTLTLSLVDAKKLEGKIFTNSEGEQVKNAGGQTGSAALSGFWNLAGDVTIPEGTFTVTYTARDADGNTDTAKATFEIGDTTKKLNGGSGDDIAWVANNLHTINGGAGNDLIVVANNKGNIYADGGNDKLYIGSTENKSFATGGAGNDVINVSGINEGTISGGGGTDTITVNKNAGHIKGSIAGDDTANIDVLEGVGGSKITGEGGKDNVTLRGGGSKETGGATIATNAGSDVINLRGDDRGHKWDDGARVEDGKLVLDEAALANADKFDAQYATVKAGDGKDTLKVSDSAHDNTLYGGGEGDQVEVYNVAHHNVVYGEGGNDRLQVQYMAHHNTLSGGLGDDTLLAFNNASNNLLKGGDGKDRFFVYVSDKGTTWVDKEPGRDGEVLDSRPEGNTLFGGIGEDEFKAYNGAHKNYLYGGDDTDKMSVYGGATNNTLYGGGDGVKYEDDASKDVLFANGKGTEGNELYGGGGGDELRVYDGAKGNKLYGDEGDDSLYAQDDVEYNTLSGGADNDELHVYGTAAKNTLKGGDDGDRMYARGNATGNTLEGEDGNDLLAATGNATGNNLDGGTGADTLIVSNTDVLRVGWFYDEGTATGNVLDGGEGNDVLLAVKNTSNNTLKGGAGNDQLFTDALPESFEGIPGVTYSDVYSNAVNSGYGPQKSVFEGNAGNDTLHIRGTSQNNTFYGNDAMDSLAANAHATVPGGESDDDVFRIFGTAQNNVLYGQGGNDTFELCTDMDRVYHANTMYGGTGDDLFVTHVKYPTGTSHAGVTRASLMDGGEGNDTFIFHHKFGGIDDSDTQGANTVLGGAGDDVIIADSYMLNSSQRSQLISYNNTFDGGEGNDYLLVGNTGNSEYFQNNTMSGGAGNDVLVIRDGRFNTYEGGDGNDVIDASKGLFESTYDGGKGADLLLAQDSTGIENLKNIEAIVIKGASQITDHFNDKLLTDMMETTDAYGFKRGHAEIDPTASANKMTQKGVKDVLEDMGFFWRDDKFEFKDGWTHNSGGDTMIGTTDYQQWDNASGDISILVAESVLKNAQS